MIVVAIIGILAAIAIPNFLRFRLSARQSEARTNLKSVHLAESSFAIGRNGEYSIYLSEIAFTIERGNRYWYKLGAGADEPRSGSAVVDGVYTGIESDTYKWGGTPTFPIALGAGAPATSAGLFLDGGVNHYMATAAADIDNDATVDGWYISSMTKGGAGGCGTVVNGTASSPTNATNDGEC